MSGDNPTIDVRKGEELDVQAIDAALKSAVPGLSGMPDVKQYASGASNLTYALDYPDRRMVLRRPPFGTIPKSGHDMHREYRIMTALKPVFSAVPQTLYYTDDQDIIGAEFYVMDRSEGPLIHTKIPTDWNWGAKEGRALCEEFFAKLVDLHQVDYKAIGLEDFGRPEGYVARQIGGWNRRFEKAWTDDVEKFEDVRKWLEDNKPAQEVGAAILHGDYRIDNCILQAGDPTKINAVLDWEISALGDPLMDLGNTLAYWIEADDPAEMQMMVRQPSAAAGMMNRQEILNFYAERTGADVSNFQFYYVYGIWRLAVIIQQIYYRYYHGQTEDPRFKPYGQMVNALGNLSRQKISTGKL
ncbi:MAG: phosphotransferase family protein [Alphaproteobacteria bacterium]